MTKLVRPTQGRLLAGVCAAIANRFGWDAWLVRLVYVILSFIPGPLWVLYIVLWITIPAEQPGAATR